MNPNYLDFEQPIAELEMKIEELQGVGDDAELNLAEEIGRLREKSTALTEKIYSNLSAWDIVRVARHLYGHTPWTTFPIFSPNLMSCMGIVSSATIKPSSEGWRDWTANL